MLAIIPLVPGTEAPQAFTANARLVSRDPGFETHKQQEAWFTDRTLCGKITPFWRDTPVVEEGPIQEVEPEPKATTIYDLF